MESGCEQAMPLWIPLTAKIEREYGAVTAGAAIRIGALIQYPVAARVRARIGGVLKVFIELILSLDVGGFRLARRLTSRLALRDYRAMTIRLRRR
jgi:hypothetical protein